MAHFRGTVQGGRSEASRLGHKTTGLRVSANGWNIGVDVVLTHNSETGKDEVVVFRTGGSNSGGSRAQIAKWSEDN